MFISAALTKDDVMITLEATDQAFREIRKCRATLGPVEKIKSLLAERGFRSS